MQARDSKTILVVIYKKNINDSITLQSLRNFLKKEDNVNELIIWDNSSEYNSKEEINNFSLSFKDTKIRYIPAIENTPLSKIYNYIISLVSTSWLILLDDDTNLTDVYFNELNSVFKSIFDIPNLILPQIYFNNQLVSPAKQFFIFGKRIKFIKNGLIKAKHSTAINSGMCINVQYLKEKFPGYNEKINFYGTDNDFMLKYSDHNTFFYVLNTKLTHTLNLFSDLINNKDVSFRIEDTKNGILEITKDRYAFLFPVAYIYITFFKFKIKLKKILCNLSIFKK
ncbi:MAG: glycosyltransferase [Muribaculaceae bacterium]|nr:glycosyltransferase [Muribaculaceae bacterium]